MSFSSLPHSLAPSLPQASPTTIYLQTMVEVFVSRLGIDSASQQYVIVLQEKGGERCLPIWIGQAEAESIVMHMHNLKRPRPLTHDLCRSIIEGLGATLTRVRITRVEKNTYYAELHLAHAAGVAQIDARPSDSIAIALRLNAPIFADESLLLAVEERDGEEVDRDLKSAAETERLSAEQLKAHLERLRPEDFGEFKL
jgi:bifunctional DNase/RNase